MEKLADVGDTLGREACKIRWNDDEYGGFTARKADERRSSLLLLAVQKRRGGNEHMPRWPDSDETHRIGPGSPLPQILFYSLSLFFLFQKVFCFRYNLFSL